MYVLHIKPGFEESAAYELMKRGFRVICPTVEMQIRNGGQWNIRRKLLFTQYIFIECDLDDKIYYKIKSVSGVVRFLGHGKPEPLPVDERAYIMLLGNSGRPITPSKVYITSSGEKMIMSGMLRKYSDKIISLDLRQRRAKIKITLHGKEHIITLPVIGI